MPIGRILRIIRVDQTIGRAARNVNDQVILYADQYYRFDEQAMSEQSAAAKYN